MAYEYSSVDPQTREDWAEGEIQHYWVKRTTTKSPVLDENDKETTDSDGEKVYVITYSETLEPATSATHWGEDAVEWAGPIERPVK